MMDNPGLYRIISHLDKPKRFMTFSMDELVIVMTGMMMLVMSNYKVLVGLFVSMIFGLLKHLKQGNGPRYLFVLLYWFIPGELSQLVVAELPRSHLRKWRG